MRVGITVGKVVVGRKDGLLVGRVVGTVVVGLAVGMRVVGRALGCFVVGFAEG